eukprot:scaffold95870_cov48-Phaeocystis_antarctica.AAC.1
MAPLLDFGHMTQHCQHIFRLLDIAVFSLLTSDKSHPHMTWHMHMGIITPYLTCHYFNMRDVAELKRLVLPAVGTALLAASLPLRLSSRHFRRH